MFGNNEGYLTILCCVCTSGIEEILLREILKDFEPEHHIIKTGDFFWKDEEDNEHVDIEFTTDIKWEDFNKQQKENS